jgi:hypothetical protein
MSRRKKEKDTESNQPALSPEMETPALQPEVESQGFTKEGSDPRPTVERVSFKLTPEGMIDFDSMRSATREKFESAIKGDPRARALASGGSLSAGPIRMIQPKHAKGFLWFDGLLKKWIVPRIVESQTEGKIKANPAVAEKVFVFTDKQSDEMAEPLSQALDEKLPIRVKQWICELGPGAEFFGLYLEASKVQLQTYVMVCMSMIPAGQPEQQGTEYSPNGSVTPINIA